MCRSSLSRISAKNGIAVIKPGCPRHLCCSCRVLGGWVRMAMFVCHIDQMVGFWKVHRKKKEPETTARCQNVELSNPAPANRDIKKAIASCWLLPVHDALVLRYSCVQMATPARGSTGPTWSSPGSRCEMRPHVSDAVTCVCGDGTAGMHQRMRGYQPLRASFQLFIVLRHCLVLSQHLCTERI